MKLVLPILLLNYANFHRDGARTRPGRVGRVWNRPSCYIAKGTRIKGIITR